MPNPERQGGWGSGGAATATIASTNPFNTPMSTQVVNPFAKPMGNPFQGNQTVQAVAHNPFGSKSTTPNPFLAATSSAQKRSASPSFGQPQNAAPKPNNPFGGRKPTPDTEYPKPSSYPANPSTFGNASQSNGTRKHADFVQPAWPKRGNGTASATKPAALKAQTNGKRKGESDFQGRSKSSRSSPDSAVVPARPSSGNRPSRGENRNAKDSSSHGRRAPAIEAQIQQQFAKEGIKPPPWPTNPGSVSQRPAMEAFRESYKAFNEKARNSLIRAGLIDDPDKRRTLDEALDFRGIAEDMCPEWEKITRITEYDIRKPEKEVDYAGDLVAKPSIMVKRLARSAAGQDAPLPMDVRSFACLRRTLDYLIDDLIPSDDLLQLRHNFLWDRTRAIRIDLSVQKYNMTADERNDLIYCLETIARFHVISLHLMSQEGFAPEDFSEQQEVEQLGKTLMSLKELYDDCVQQGIECENEAEFRGYYLIFNAHNPAMKEVVGGWGTRLWNQDGIRTATCLVESIENTSRLHGPLNPHAPTELALNMASMFFSIIASPQISYTMACFAEIHFNRVRKSMLQIIRKAYSRPRDGPKDITPAFLKERLRFDTEHEALDFAQQHGFEFSEQGGQKYLVVNSRQGFNDARVRHAFSRNIVERKRSDRPLPDVIHATVYEKVQTESSILNPEDSLFVSDSGDASLDTTNGQAFESEVDNADAAPPSSPPVTTDALPSPFRKPTVEQSAVPAAPQQSATSIFLRASNPAGPPTAGLFPSTSSTPATTIASKPVGGISSLSQPWPTKSQMGTGDHDNTQGPPESPVAHTSVASTKKKVTFSETGSIAPGTTANSTTSLFGFLNDKDRSKDPTIPTNPSPASIFSGFPSKQEISNNSAQSTTLLACETSSAPGLGSPSIATSSNTTTQPRAMTSTSSPSLFPTLQAPDASGANQVSSYAQISATLPPNSSSVISSAATAAGVASETYNSLFGGPPQATPTTPSVPLTNSAPKVSTPSVPKPDRMANFTKWYVCGDKGLLEEQLQPFAVEQVLKKIWDDFQVSEEERRRKEEDDKSWAEARRFRTYSLGVTYFYRWRDTCRSRRVVKRIQMEKEKARQWRLPENVAEREAERERAAKAKKEKTIEGAKELMRRRTKGNVEETARLRSSTRSGGESRDRSVEEALLASGVLKGVRNERAAARHAARDDNIDSENDVPTSEKIRLHSENQRRRKRGLPPLKRFPEPKTYKEGSKTAKLKAISNGTGRDSMSVSTGSLRDSTFSSSYRSSLGFNNGRVAKSRSKVTDPYWRMKANGLVQMPNGEYLHESLALPMLQEGKRFPGLGDYGLPPEASATSSQSPRGSPDIIPYTTPSAVDGARRSRVSRSPSIFEGAAQKRKRGRAEDEDLAVFQSEGPTTRKRARSGDANMESKTGDDDFLASIAELMKQVDGATKTTS
ncbi:Uu.00g083960.m01.CDS01 [Anthostomella pinea]|uniref:Uu.00g083960.m01.CDS01 n=1 Tax=Anthostomella pinea TaxID=933095 RepID=A0AAI8VMT9_9PEZI|nr:Uu.00g083960.m01.CDS01 [Anthostomella pinea]